MADIYTFPAPKDGRGGAPRAKASGSGRPHGVPEPVWHAVETIQRMRRLDDVHYREIPVPSTLADYGIGVEIECMSYEEGANRIAASGWIMVLYSADTRTDWESRWRCVAFGRLPLDGNGRDCLTPAMYWDDMKDQLGGAGARNIGGTVTVTQNTSFGTVTSEPHAGCEIRVSWTPAELPEGDVDASKQVMAWTLFLRASLNDDERETIG